MEKEKREELEHHLKQAFINREQVVQNSDEDQLILHIMNQIDRLVQLLKIYDANQENVEPIITLFTDHIHFLIKKINVFNNPKANELVSTLSILNLRFVELGISSPNLLETIVQFHGVLIKIFKEWKFESAKDLGIFIYNIFNASISIGSCHIRYLQIIDDSLYSMANPLPLNNSELLKIIKCHLDQAIEFLHTYDAPFPIHSIMEIFKKLSQFYYKTEDFKSLFELHQVIRKLTNTININEWEHEIVMSYMKDIDDMVMNAQADFGKK